MATQECEFGFDASAFSFEPFLHRLPWFRNRNLSHPSRLSHPFTALSHIHASWSQRVSSGTLLWCKDNILLCQQGTWHRKEKNNVSKGRLFVRIPFEADVLLRWVTSCLGQARSLICMGSSRRLHLAFCFFFWQKSVFASIFVCTSLSLGKGPASKSDEFLEKFQTAFD